MIISLYGERYCCLHEIAEYLVNKYSITVKIHIYYNQKTIDNDKNIKFATFSKLSDWLGHMYKEPIDAEEPKNKTIRGFLSRNFRSTNIKYIGDTRLTYAKKTYDNILDLVKTKLNLLKHNNINVCSTTTIVNHIVNTLFHKEDKVEFKIRPLVISKNFIKYDEQLPIVNYIMTQDRKLTDVGFIILRCVIDAKTNEYWQKCYRCIRRFYPNNKIIIVDDHSNSEYVTDLEMTNCLVHKSELTKGCGEFLPYHYYYHNPFCERLVVFHDSMFIQEFIDFSNIENYNCFTRLLHFGNAAYNIDIDYFKEFCNYINHGDTIFQYHRDHVKTLLGCFGNCYIIDHTFLKQIQSKYNILNLCNYVDHREKRKTLERFQSCLFEYEQQNLKFQTLTSHLGDYRNAIKGYKILKIFTGR